MASDAWDDPTERRIRMLEDRADAIAERRRADREAARAEVSALRAALEQIAEMDPFFGNAMKRIARDALGRYPKEASDG